MKLHRRVAFAETDASGRVHFTSILRWAEEAEHEVLRQRGVTIASGDEGWPRVQVSCDYLRPLTFGEEVLIEVQLVEIGSTSLTWRFCVLNQAEEKAAKGSLVTVWVAGGSKSQIDEATRKRLQAVLEE